MTSTIKVNKIEKVDGSTIEIGGPGTAVNLACGATQTGFGRTGTVDWCTTAKTSPFTSESGKGYFVNTTSGSVTVTLPASPSAGDIVSIKDYANTFDTSPAILGRNGSKISSVCADADLETEGQSITMVYVDATQGWLNIQTDATITGNLYIQASGGTIVNCGAFRTHIFTSSDNFVVSELSVLPANNKIDYLVVGGGAGGGTSCAGGAGGAGGFRVSNELVSAPAPTMSPLANPTGLTATVATFPITVGAGGAGNNPGGYAPTSDGKGTNGNTTTFSTITSAGGGAGGGEGPSPTSATRTGNDGASGGGGSHPGRPGGAGNTPPVSPPQGNAGAASAPGTTTSDDEGGAGGGAAAAGSNLAGGIGSFVADPFIGPTAPSYGTPGPATSVRYFSGGGGGGARNFPNATIPASANAGGAGGGGRGGDGKPGQPTQPRAASGTANTGGGGGGGFKFINTPAPYPLRGGGDGGSGIVMIRYKFVS